MKRISILPLLLTVMACDPEPVLIQEQTSAYDSSHTGMFILSEGLFNQNSSTLAWHDFSTGTTDSWQSRQGKSYDCFEKANGRRLGDTANDMLIYGSRLYIAVSESGTVEVIDPATCLSLGQIPMQGAQPRALAASEGHVYVCCFDGTVARIDTVTMSITGTVRAGRNPDGLCCTHGKLYVSNSGGLDTGNPDSTVSVISLDTFTETGRITLRPNPGRICTDGTSVFVISRGLFDYGTNSYDCRLHRIDAASDILTDTYDIHALNMDIAGSTAWLYEYGSGRIMVMETPTGLITDSCFIKDRTRIECPYGIKADAATGKLYVCDAADYVTPGSVLCFDSDGFLEYRIAGIGINPNTIQPYDAVVMPDENTQTALEGHISKVFEYRPAPGQFVNVLPQYAEGDNDSTMAAKCLTRLRGNGMITLGGFGGYITAGFDKPVMNLEGMDFEIDGNAIAGNAEPGVVWISADADGNGLPDDEWFQIAGSEHSNSVGGYTVTYRKQDGDIPWYGSDGQSGTIFNNSFHAQSYWPMWYDRDSVSFSATLLPDNVSMNNGTWVMSPFGWGYADNLPNGSEGSRFDISWAVRADGTPAGLDHMDFIKIQTGSIGCNTTTGEMSTEITAIFDLNP